jgi:hypothetical protein
MAEMGAGHFIYIPAILLIGIVIGWILGGRAARDAYAAELRRRDQGVARARRTSEPPPDTARDERHVRRA